MAEVNQQQPSPARRAHNLVGKSPREAGTTRGSDCPCGAGRHPPSLARSVTLDKLVNFSELLFLLLLTVHFTGSLGRVSDMMHMTQSAQCLAHNRC